MIDFLKGLIFFLGLVVLGWGEEAGIGSICVLVSCLLSFVAMLYWIRGIYRFITR